MQASFDLLFPGCFDWETFISQRPLEPFCPKVCDFLSALSKSILTDRETRGYPDVATFAYFCRKSNLQAINEYSNHSDIRLGRGTLFHIAPSNVPVNFAYSLIAGLLAGNTNIVRVSSKPFPQVNFIVKHLHKVAQEAAHQPVASRIAIVRYDRNSNATAEFSSLADARIIWGGDETIATIRKCPLPPRSFDVCFADRHSMAVIDPDAVLEADYEQMQRLAIGFYNDTFLFDQNACSAPHVVGWLPGIHKEKAKAKFWQEVHKMALAQYQLQPVLCVDKLTAFFKQATAMAIHREPMPDNLIVRVKLEQLPSDIESWRCAGGYFAEIDIDNLSSMLPAVTRRTQTLAYFGLSKQHLMEFIGKSRPFGIDRIVPIGATTNFSLHWDGFDLIRTLSREITIR